jgi:hypothetical protein
VNKSGRLDEYSRLMNFCLLDEQYPDATSSADLGYPVGSFNRAARGTELGDKCGEIESASLISTTGDIFGSWSANSIPRYLISDS